MGWATLGDLSVAGDTETYALRYGVRGFTMENGQWCWEGSAACALNVASRFLSYSGLQAASSLPSVQQQIFTLFHVQNKLREGFRYARAWNTFDVVERGTVILE